MFYTCGTRSHLRKLHVFGALGLRMHTACIQCRQQQLPLPIVCASSRADESGTSSRKKALIAGPGMSVPEAVCVEISKLRG